MNDDSERPRESLAALVEQNRKLPLGRYLRDLARASAMTSAIAIAGCGGGDWIDTEDAILPTCEGFQTPGEPPFRWRATQGLNPAVDYDSLQVYRLDEGPGFSPFLLDSDGEPCRAAADPDTCEMLIEAAADEIGQVHLITTSGDVVQTFIGQEELMQFPPRFHWVRRRPRCRAGSGACRGCIHADGGLRAPSANRCARRSRATRSRGAECQRYHNASGAAHGGWREPEALL